MTVHEDIDNYLAADVHHQLSEDEQNALYAHLVECADCRKIHQETKIMNKILEDKFTAERPDAAFEQRILSDFRNRVPERTGFVKLLANLMRMRATQITAVAAVLLTLVQVGRMVTGEGKATPANREYYALEDSVGQSFPSSNQVGGVARPEPRAKESDHVANLKSSAAESTVAAPAPPPTGALSGAESYSKDEVSRWRTGTGGLKPSTAYAAPSDNTNGTTEKVIVTGSNVPVAEEVAPSSSATPAALANRKLIRNATVDLEIVSFDNAVQKITALANEERGYVATSSSEKQENGKLSGEVVVKVLPENLDTFLQKIRGLGELKNQTLGTEDVTKNYFDTDARLKNARVMEQRLIEMLKTKTGKVSDLLQVEKELGRVREEIEKMQGELKFWDSQVQFATVTINLAEKDMEIPAAFLLKERAQLALYTPEVEKVYNNIKALGSPKVQITNAQLDRDNTGRVSARLSMLIGPEESDAVITQIKAMGRVENFQVQTERQAQGGDGMAENAKTKRDKVELNITLSRDEQEQSLQQTSLRIRTSSVDEKAKALRNLAEKQNGRVRASSFSRDTDGGEFANVTLRVPMKNYSALMQSLDSLGKVENISVQRQDRPGVQIDEANAPADVSIQVYSQGNIVSQNSGLWATLRRTIGQSAGAVMWSARMIGVAIAFLAPWAVALVCLVWIAKRVIRARRKL